MIRKLKICWLLIPIILSSLALPSPALAQQASSLSIEISPLPIELTTKPGTSTSATLRVRNSGTLPEVLKASLKIFSQDGPNGTVNLRNPGPGDEVVKWVSFDRPVFLAPPGEWQSIKMTVNVPASAAFGYYYAVQFALANPPKTQPGQAGLQGAVAIFVLLNADAPGASRKIDVTTFSSDHTSYEFLPVNFTVRVHNSGNVHAAPHGNIFIKRGSKQVAALDVNSTEGQVLPGSNRVFKVSWNDGFPVYVPILDASGQPVLDKNGQPKMSLKWDFSKVSHLRFGHYTADLLLVYNDGQRDIPITGTLSFWVVPWRIVAAVLIIGVFMAIGIWATLRRGGRLIKRHTSRGPGNAAPR